MHEQAVIADVVRKVEEVARAGGAIRVTKIAVRLGALSHFTAEHFRDHFADASQGTIAEGADVEAVCENDVSLPHAADVVLEAVEVEVPEPSGAS